MEPSESQLQTYLLGPIVQHWFHRFGAAEKSKERFATMGRLCRQFLGSSAKAMWEDDFRKEFFPSVAQPNFMVSLNKAFELVAVIGPSLFWDKPAREVQSPDTPDQTTIAQILGIMDQPMLEQIQHQQQMAEAASSLRNSLCTLALEHFSRAFPDVKRNMELIIQDALVTGRGCGWTQVELNEATGQFEIGTVYDSSDNLLIDPDATSPDWADVRWIARKSVAPVWEVEKTFGYPPGYFRGKGTKTSTEYLMQNPGRNQGQDLYCDLMEYIEVWSVAGIGARVTGSDPRLGQALDVVTGDNCYLAVSQNVQHPLNLPPLLVKQGTPDDIRAALNWRTAGFGVPFDLWKDGRWPVEVLDFYPTPNSVWPQAVLGPGMGALLAMNLILISQLEQSWDRRRDIIAVYEHFYDQVDAAIRSENNPAVIKLNAASGQDLTKMLFYLQRPEIQGNLLEWLQYLDNQFQRATGLDDLHYGVSQRQVRVSSDIQARQAAANVRPDKMATDVHQFVVASSTKELWAAAQYVRGGQLYNLLGEWGSIAWDVLVSTPDIAELANEMQVFVEATDMKRPNRDKDMNDLEKLLPYWMPLAQAYAQQTQDTKPLNALLSLYGKAADMKNVEDLFFGDWATPVDPAVAQLQQQQIAADVQQTVASTEETKAKTTGRLIDAMYKQQGATAPMAQKLKWNEVFNRQKMIMQEQAHLQQMLHVSDEQRIKERQEKPK